MSPHNLAAPSKSSSVTMAVSLITSPLAHSSSPKGYFLWMTCPYISSQNSKAILHTINNMLCSLFFQTSIPARYWIEGLHTATYLLNRLPTKGISTTSPYFVLYGVTPSYEHLLVFGCVCYPNLSAKAAHKLAPQSIRCIFLGYSTDHKGYRCLDLTTDIVVS
jgi:hypothetical protein